MKKLIILLIVLGLSVLVALRIKADPGYLMIAYRDYLIDMPLWLAVLILVLGFFLISWIWRFIKEVYLTPHHIADWYKQKMFARVRRRTVRGFIALAEGRWADAEHLLSKNIDKRHTALLNCLGAAVAAQKQGKELERDEYLRLAHSYHSHAQIAIGLTQARLQYMQGQFEQCLASLRRLLLISPDHATVLSLLKFVLIDLKAWDELLDLLPTLEKKHLISETEIQQLTQQAYVALLSKAKTAGSDTMDRLWQGLSKKWQQNPELLSQYVPFLLSSHRYDEAEELLRQGLKYVWDSRLIRYYGITLPQDKDKQMKTAHGYLKQHPEDPMLLLTLGRLYFREDILGQANIYLEKSAAIAPSPETYLLLGDVAVKMNVSHKAEQYYKQGLQIACQQKGESHETYSSDSIRMWSI